MSPSSPLSRSPVIVALDVDSLDRARALALHVAQDVGMIKVGLELFTRGGPEAARLGGDTSLPVFLDLKLHDIPETVDRAVARACDLGVSMLTVHASGGPRMLARAVERAEKSRTGLTITAVTVLTSLDDTDMRAIGFVKGASESAIQLAMMAAREGVRAFVCSPTELTAMRAALGPEPELVTPGIRGPNDPASDQKRTASPGDAIRAGATWLVVGRPIRDAADPALAARLIAEEACKART